MLEKSFACEEMALICSVICNMGSDYRRKDSSHTSSCQRERRPGEQRLNKMKTTSCRRNTLHQGEEESHTSLNENTVRWWCGQHACLPISWSKRCNSDAITCSFTYCYPHRLQCLQLVTSSARVRLTGWCGSDQEVLIQHPDRKLYMYHARLIWIRAAQTSVCELLGFRPIC